LHTTISFLIFKREAFKAYKGIMEQRQQQQVEAGSMGGSD
jgi:hypothetical protein